MLKLVTDVETLKDCVIKMSKYFKETWDISLEELIEDSNYKVFTVIKDEVNVYYAIRYITETKNETQVDFYFSLLQEDYRGQGIGTKALIECIDWFNENYKKCVFKASCRYSNVPSFKVFERAGFSITNNNITGSEKGADLILSKKEVDITDCYYEEGYCGLSSLTMIHNYKNFKSVTSKDLLEKVTTITGQGIPQQTMLRNVFSLFGEYVNTVKVINNLTNDNDWCLHKIKQQVSKHRGVALMNVMSNDNYPHWIVVYNYDKESNRYFIYDVTNGLVTRSELDLLTQSVQRNMFTILF